MRNHLRHGPIDRSERGLGEPERRGAVAPHRLGGEIGFEIDVEAAIRPVAGVVKMRQRRRIAFGPRERRGVERRQRFRGHQPGRNRGGEILAEERPERLIFPCLHVARRPVVEQAVAEHMSRRRADRDRRAEIVSRADEHSELEFEIEIARWAVARHGIVLPFALAARPFERNAADPDRRGAAVIRDRHIFVVRHQRIVGPEHAAGIAGVKD
jgi:hypothetical protein